MMMEPKLILSFLPLLLLAPSALTKTYPGSMLRDFSCPQPHGYFKHTDQCDEYVECKNYVPRAYSCPIGLHFNTRAQWVDYPCDHPSRVECTPAAVVPVTTSTTTTTTTTPAPVVVAPRDFSCPQRHGYFKQSQQCDEYVECKNYIPRSYSCPAGLHFNNRAQWTEYPCEQPSKVECYQETVIPETTSTTTTTTTTTTTPAPTPVVEAPREFSCPEPHGYFRQSDQCGQYVECKNYVPRTYACPAGLHFNARAQWTEYPCEQPSKVECYQEPVIPITTTTTTTTTTTPPPPTTPAPAVVAPRDFSCPQQHGYFKHTEQCGEYVECKNNVPRTLTCPADHHFNPDVEWTDYPCHHSSNSQCYN